MAAIPRIGFLDGVRDSAPTAKPKVSIFARGKTEDTWLSIYRKQSGISPAEIVNCCIWRTLMSRQSGTNKISNCRNSNGSEMIRAACR